MDNTVYLGLGSNIGDSCSIIQRAICVIETIPGVQLLSVSSFYQTTPVSPIAQRDFINAACALNTTLSPEALYDALHRIEVLFGKTSEEKNAPRSIDIDILFFGTRFYHTSELCIPHPRWRERLFVLTPLSEITEEIIVPLNEHEECETIRLKEYLAAFTNPHQERVMRLANESIH
jgi:2-amino-4-hydroxy-6-hydroxymethyldihydropteridine diphosphokinase